MKIRSGSTRDHLNTLSEKDGANIFLHNTRMGSIEMKSGTATPKLNFHTEDTPNLYVDNHPQASPTPITLNNKNININSNNDKGNEPSRTLQSNNLEVSMIEAYVDASGKIIIGDISQRNSALASPNLNNNIIHNSKNVNITDSPEFARSRMASVQSVQSVQSLQSRHSEIQSITGLPNLDANLSQTMISITLNNDKLDKIDNKTTATGIKHSKMINIKPTNAMFTKMKSSQTSKESNGKIPKLESPMNKSQISGQSNNSNQSNQQAPQLDQLRTGMGHESQVSAEHCNPRQERLFREFLYGSQSNIPELPLHLNDQPSNSITTTMDTVTHTTLNQRESVNTVTTIQLQNHLNSNNMIVEAMGIVDKNRGNGNNNNNNNSSSNYNYKNNDKNTKPGKIEFISYDPANQTHNNAIMQTFAELANMAGSDAYPYPSPLTTPIGHSNNTSKTANTNKYNINTSNIDTTTTYPELFTGVAENNDTPLSQTNSNTAKTATTATMTKTGVTIDNAIDENSPTKSKNETSNNNNANAKNEMINWSITTDLETDSGRNSMTAGTAAGLKLTGAAMTSITNASTMDKSSAVTSTIASTTNTTTNTTNQSQDNINTTKIKSIESSETSGHDNRQFQIMSNINGAQNTGTDMPSLANYSVSNINRMHMNNNTRIKTGPTKSLVVAIKHSAMTTIVTNSNTKNNNNTLQIYPAGEHHGGIRYENDMSHDTRDTHDSRDTNDINININTRETSRASQSSVSNGEPEPGLPLQESVIIHNSSNNNNTNSNIRDWTYQDVCDWLKSELLNDSTMTNDTIDKIILKFEMNYIGGHVLLVLDQELLESIGIETENIRQKILEITQSKLNSGSLRR